MSIAILSRNREQKISMYQEKPVDLVKGWIMSGRGKVSKEGHCGKAFASEKGMGIYTCETHKSESLIIKRNNCKKLSCPVCFKGGAMQVSERVRDKLYRYGKMTGVRLPIHISINVQDLTEEILTNEKEWTKYRRKLYLKLFDSGMEAGVLFFHLYRFSEDKERLEISPHFHALIFGKMIQGDDFFDKFGFVYKAHPVECVKCHKKPKFCSCDKPRYRYVRNYRKRFDSMDEVQSTIYYLMTHSAIRSDRLANSYYYVGELTSRKIRIKKDFDDKPIKHKKSVAIWCSQCYLVDKKANEKLYHVIAGYKKGSEEIEIDFNKIEFDKSDWHSKVWYEYEYEFTKHSKWYKEENDMKYFSCEYTELLA